jgi:glycine betaine/proline transport system ATP-binding protein
MKSSNDIAIKIDAASVVFGNAPQSALPLMDAGKTRSEIQDETDQILGVHDCSIDVQEGELLVLMGLSGSGKSTLLRTLNGLNPVVRGSVSIKDGDQLTNVTTANPRELRRLRQTRVAMVFQHFGLLPWRTVTENVGLGLELSGQTKAQRHDKVMSVLEMVGLDRWADSSVGALSGGMQQRVGLARAFATDAPILLMDEPFSALDPLIRTKLQDELLELQSKLKRTIVFVSHDLDEAFKLGNRIAIMEGGRIVQCGSPRDIAANPANEYVAEFISDSNPLTYLAVDDFMQKSDGTEANSVQAHTPIMDALDQIATSDTPVAVKEDGIAIGQISARGILKHLAQK